jgi:hypothetical protein
MRRSTLVAIVALSFSWKLAAADPAPDDGPTPAAPDSGTVLLDNSPFEKLPSWIQIGGQIRGRFEGVSGTSLINNSPDNYYASRLRIDLGFKPTSWLRFFAQVSRPNRKFRFLAK